MSLLEVEDFSVRYAGASQPAVRNLSFSMEKGEALGVAGESGSGKSQTALGIMGLLPPEASLSGSIRLAGSDLAGQPAAAMNRIRARRIAIVFQDSQQALNPYVRVGDQLRRVLIEHRIARGAKAATRARGMLERVGLPDADRQYRSFPHQLSGGMRQRAMIALALACAPELLIADEPTTALDVTVQAQILDLLRTLKEETGIAILLITHDLGVIAGNCERTMILHRGALLEQGPTAPLLARPAHPQTRALVAAHPRLDAPAPRRPTAGAEPPVLTVEGLSLSFAHPRKTVRPGKRLTAVNDIGFSLHRGETLAIVGESGSGKTSVARAVLGLLPADSGVIAVFGSRVAAALEARSPAQRHQMQMVFQDAPGSLNPAMTVAATIGEALAMRQPKLDRGERHARVVAALERTGLGPELLPRLAHELSGGQAQRVAIARALALEPGILFCDEAVAALDGTVRQGILDLLRAEQRASGLSLVFITHDLGVVRQLSHRVLVMRRGRLCELASNESLFHRPRHPYTRTLLDAVPTIAPVEKLPG